jgi:hypothetical protein
MTLPHYSTFRKVDGKLYTAQSARRSVISALSANGIFEQNVNETPSGQKERVYFVNKQMADKWVQE